MDLTLRAASLSPDTPLWIKALPLVFVALVAYGVATDGGDRPSRDRGDVTTVARPN